MGPNLQQEFVGDQIPNLHTQSDWNDLDDKDGNAVFWTTRIENYLELSMSCGWRFTNLRVAFRLVVREPSRSLHVYSDVAGNSIVGNRVTDLLREVKYQREGRGTIYFEPLHIQYVPLRNEVIEIIQTRLVETDGEIVTFGEGNTIVTLHLTKTLKEIKNNKVNNHGSEKKTTTKKKSNKRRLRTQLGKGTGTAVAGLPKAAWKITKGMEMLAKKGPERLI